jgi:tetratricopeptide (TPR) repeat protein
MRKVFSLLVVSILSLGTLAAQSDLTVGIKHIANENYGDAVKFFESIASKEPKNGMPHYYLGKIKYALEDYIGASSLFDKGALLDKKCAACQIGQAQILLDNGKNLDADKKLMAIEKSNKKSASVMALIGDAYLYSTKPNVAKAISYLIKSRDMDPKVGSTWSHLGEAFNANNEPGNAMSSFEVAVTKDKKNVEALVAMAKIWRAGRQLDLSAEKLEEAVKQSPDYGPAYKDLIETYMRLEKYSKVTPLLEKYVTLAGSDEQAKVRLVKFLCFQAKDYERAIKEGEELKKTSKDYTINRWLGWSYIETGKFEEGYQLMKSFIAECEADPTKKKAFMLDYDYLAKAALNSNRTEEALAAYEKVFQQDPTKAEEVYTNLAKTYYDSKDYANAILYYNKRNEIKALNNSELFRLGQSFNQVKNYVEAEKTFRSYIALDQSFPNAYYALARAVANQDPDRVTYAAIPDYQKFLEVANVTEDKSKLEKSIIESYLYIGYGMVQKGDNVAAKSAFDSVLLINPLHEDAKKNSDILVGGGK